MHILIADDHDLFRDGLRFQIEELIPEAQVTDARTFEEAVTVVQHAARPVSLAVMDLTMPSMSWREALMQLKEAEKAPDIVVVSATDDTSVINEAMAYGVIGYIPKSSPTDVVVGALRLVLDGGVYLPPELVGGRLPVRNGLRQGASNEVILTQRMQDVLDLINDKGYSNKQIAVHLGLSQATVKLHVSRLFKRLGVSSRTEALAKARSLKLV